MNSRGWWYLILFALFCIVYLLRFQRKSNLRKLAKKRVKISARLSDIPRLQGGNQIFQIANIWVETDDLNDLSYGDQLIVIGTTQERVINKFFSQIWLINPDILKVEEREWRVESGKNLRIEFLKAIYHLRCRINEVYKRTLTEPQASLLSGVVIGTRENMPYDFWQALKNTGTLHIVAASGMNISLLVGSLVGPLTWVFKRKQALIVALFFILIYCLIAGASPAVLRAGIMGVIAYLAVFLGRDQDGMIALLATGVIMLWVEPFLIFDVGFQLSFMAMLGMILVVPYLKKQKLFKKRFFQMFGNEFLETTAATITTAPILIITFGQFNPLSIIPNQFVLFLVPYLMILGAVQAILGLIFFPLGQIVSLLTFVPLAYFVTVIKFFGRFDFLNLSLPKLGLWFVIGYYLILAAILSFRTRFGIFGDPEINSG